MRSAAELRDLAARARGELAPHLKPSDWGTTVRVLLCVLIEEFTERAAELDAKGGDPC